MRSRIAVVVVALAFTLSLSAKDVYLSVSGKANGFFTDARIFNPSHDKDITIQARYLPAGNHNNSGVAPVTLTIPKRTMKVYDDAVQSIFGGGPALGAIRLTSDDDFAASERIYFDARAARQGGTLGQFVVGLDVTTAKTKGVMLQLKAGDASLGNFRTNWGGVNPNATMAHVTLSLYDRNNALAATKTVMLEPYAVLAPSSIVGLFDNTSANLTDAWISFVSDVPVFLYSSVVDNGSSDPTFIAAVEDTGVAPHVPPPPPPVKTVTIHGDDGFFAFSGLDGLAKGDQVKFVATGDGGVHGIRVYAPDAAILFTLDPLGANPVERTVTLTQSGAYVYVCTRPTCSSGHVSMSGEFAVKDK